MSLIYSFDRGTREHEKATFRVAIGCANIEEAGNYLGACFGHRNIRRGPRHMVFAHRPAQDGATGPLGHLGTCLGYVTEAGAFIEEGGAE